MKSTGDKTINTGVFFCIVLQIKHIQRDTLMHLPFSNTVKLNETQLKKHFAHVFSLFWPGKYRKCPIVNQDWLKYKELGILLCSWFPKNKWVSPGNVAITDQPKVHRKRHSHDRQQERTQHFVCHPYTNMDKSLTEAIYNRRFYRDVLPVL